MRIENDFIEYRFMWKLPNSLLLHAIISLRDIGTLTGFTAYNTCQNVFVS